MEEYETAVEAQQNCRDESQTQLEKTSKIVIEIKSGVEHLAEKLKVLKPVCNFILL